jgi:hypothetical protein
MKKAGVTKSRDYILSKEREEEHQESRKGNSDTRESTFGL